MIPPDAKMALLIYLLASSPAPLFPSGSRSRRNDRVLRRLIETSVRGAIIRAPQAYKTRRGLVKCHSSGAVPGRYD